MKMVVKMFVAAYGLVALAPALAQEAAPAPAPTAAPAPVAEKKICRSVQVTGSMMPKRTCHTHTEWAAIDQANTDAVQNMRNHAGSGSTH